MKMEYIYLADQKENGTIAETDKTLVNEKINKE